VAASGVAQEITDRGRVVAILSPPPAGEGLERLRRLGLTKPPCGEGVGKVLDRLQPLIGTRELRLGEALAEQRDTER